MKEAPASTPGSPFFPIQSVSATSASQRGIFVLRLVNRQLPHADAGLVGRYERTCGQVVSATRGHLHDEITQRRTLKTLNPDPNYGWADRAGECHEHVEVRVECDHDATVGERQCE